MGGCSIGGCVGGFFGKVSSFVGFCRVLSGWGRGFAKMCPVLSGCVRWVGGCGWGLWFGCARPICPAGSPAGSPADCLQLARQINLRATVTKLACAGWIMELLKYKCSIFVLYSRMWEEVI